MSGNREKEKGRKRENEKSERMQRQPSTKGTRFGCLLFSLFHSLAFSRSVPQCWTQSGLLKSPPASSQLRFPVLFRRKWLCRALARTFQDRIGDATPAAHQRAAAPTIRPNAPIRLRPDGGVCRGQVVFWPGMGPEASYSGSTQGSDTHRFTQSLARCSKTGNQSVLRFSPSHGHLPERRPYSAYNWSTATAVNSEAV